MENLNDYKSAYHAQFKFYNENQWYLSQYFKYMADTIGAQKFKSVLSLGIGHQVVSGGFVSMLTNKQIDSYDIVEGAESIIAEFRDRHKAINNINLYHAYFENFSSDKKYDAIEMGFVLEHVDDPKVIIDRFKDFLTEDGIIFIAVPNAKSLHRLIGHYANLLPDMYKLSQYDLQLGHKRYFDLQKIEDVVTSCGLKVTAKKGLMLKPITGEQIGKLEWDSNIISALMIIGESYPEIANCIYIEAKS
jgi:SAM-dependent methyltransferase